MAASTRIPFPKADSSSSSIRVSLKTNGCGVSDLGFVTSELSGVKISKVDSFQPVRPIFTKFSPALQPVALRSAKFIASKNWIVTGSDDGFIRVYNYKTMEKIIEVEAHKDFIRCVVVHFGLKILLIMILEEFGPLNPSKE
ncbi:uncharacterized protein LOC115722776 isoform X1 [Cannabis sativa]|uniref:uncharacterized protein LOC115722776 isoform X1 n=1 Tax=Cannabis sativa TaxID=3483 RepID=UPI0029CAAB48|nr:uncharacterized protein LOC115722776 isoform X1 [Cannabis sativa]